MLIRVNVGSALNPKSEVFEETTLLRDVMTIPEGAQVTVDGVVVGIADLGKSLADLNIGEGTHILYSSKREGAGEEA